MPVGHQGLGPFQTVRLHQRAIAHNRTRHAIGRDAIRRSDSEARVGFDGVFDLVSKRIVGEKHLKLVLRPAGGEQAIDAIAFNTVDDDWPVGVNQVELAYRLDVNEFNGKCSAQLMVEHIEPVLVFSL